MEEQKHTEVLNIARLEPDFAAALEDIRIMLDLTPAQLLRQINELPGRSLPARARSFVLQHLRDLSQPAGMAERISGYGEDTLQAALRAVRTMKQKKKL